MRIRLLCAAFCVLFCCLCAGSYVSAATGGHSPDSPACREFCVLEPVEVSEGSDVGNVVEPTVSVTGTDDSNAVKSVYAPLSGGSYFVADSALGNALVFYVPVDYLNKLAYTSNGDLFNLSASSVYLYCPSFPDYTIYAQRFSKFQFRPNSSGYSYADCNFTNVDPVAVSILQNADKPIISTDTLIIGVLAVMVLLGCIFIIRR